MDLFIFFFASFDLLGKGRVVEQAFAVNRCTFEHLIELVEESERSISFE